MLRLSESCKVLSELFPPLMEPGPRLVSFFWGGDHIAWPRPWKNGQRIVPYSDCMRRPVLRRLGLNFIHIFEISFS